MLATVKTKKLRYFGHVMRKIGDCMLGERDHLCRHITGKEKKRKAQKHLEWKHNSTDRVLRPDQLMRQLKERLEWRDIVHSAAKPGLGPRTATDK